MARHWKSPCSKRMRVRDSARGTQPHTNPRPHIFTLWFFWTLLAGLTKSVMQLWASWLHRRFSLVKSHLHIVANTERFKQLFSSAHPCCCLRNLCLETLRDASCWKWFCSQKKTTCKFTAKRSNTRIMQKSPPVIMSVPVQTNSDISDLPFQQSI